MVSFGRLCRVKDLSGVGWGNLKVAVMRARFYEYKAGKWHVRAARRRINE